MNNFNILLDFWLGKNTCRCSLHTSVLDYAQKGPFRLIDWPMILHSYTTEKIFFIRTSFLIMVINIYTSLSRVKGPTPCFALYLL